MSHRDSSKGDRGNAPMYAMSKGDGSFDDEITSTAEQVAQVLLSHFDCGSDDPRPTSGIPMETKSRKRCSIEMASVLSESHTMSSGVTSRCWLV